MSGYSQYLCLLCLLLATGCRDEPSPQPPPQPSRATGSKIHFQDPVSVSIVQRRSELIPGMDGQLSIHIDDITRGKVLVKVVTADGDTLLPQGSMSLGAVRLFEFENDEYAIHLVELHNYLSGDDYGTFTVGVVAQDDTTPNADKVGLTETQKIEHLIAAVEGLGDATFIRNGKSYSPADAADHMRSKWRWKKDEIVTAQDFISIAATKSSVSGDVYMIRFADGREVPAGEYLHRVLNIWMEMAPD